MSKRPPNVILAAGALAFAIAVQIGLVIYNTAILGAGLAAGWAQFVFAATVFGLLLWGILHGYRLAWLWGRHLTVLLGTLVLFFVWRRGSASPVFLAIVGGGLVVPMFLTAWALGRPDSLAFFDLICPTCKTEVRRGADFMFRTARCRECGTVW